MPKGNSGKRQRFGSMRRDPYPFVYSRDLWDLRRFYPMGRNPGGGSPTRWEVRFAIALLVLLLGGSLVLLIVQTVLAIIH